MARRSIESSIRDLMQFRDDFLAGYYPQRTALGPGAISKSYIKSKSISASMLDVSELASVAANTGQLNVTGALVAGSGLNTMGYDPSNGLYIGNATPGVAPFRVSPSGDMVGESATITGDVTANVLSANDSGSIAGWTIDSSKLSDGATGVGRSGSYRIWSGNVGSPALSNFSVDQFGTIKAHSGSIAGWTADSSKFTTDSGTVGLGQNGTYRMWAGSSTPSFAEFRVDNTGAMNATAAAITGAVTATSGSFTGSVTTGNIAATGGTLAGLTINGVLTVSTSGRIQSGKTSYGSGTGWYMDYNAGSPRFDIGSSTSYLRWDGSKVTMAGRFEFGSGDYIESDQIYFTIPTTSTSSIFFDPSANSGWGVISTFGQTDRTSITVSAQQSSAIRTAYMQVIGFDTDAETYAEITATSGLGAYTRFRAFADGNLYAIMPTSDGSDAFFIEGSAGVAFGVASSGTLLSGTNDTSGGGGAYYGRIPIAVNYNGVPTTKYLRVYDS